MRRRPVFSDFGRGVVPGIAVATALVLSQPLLRAAKSPVMIGGPFTLTSSDGSAVTEQTYRGKWLLVYFGYTFCPNTCPTTLLEITAALERLGPDAAKVQPIFITVDPKRDTPDVMAKYTQSFDSRIVGLSGTPEQIAAVAQEYGVYYVAHKSGDSANDYTMDHSTYLYVMDPQGQFMQAFDADTSANRIADDLLRLVRQEDTAH